MTKRVLFLYYQDPSIQQATKSSAPVPGIDDYNPFADNNRRNVIPQVYYKKSKNIFEKSTKNKVFSTGSRC